MKNQGLCNQPNAAMYRKSIEKITSFIPYFEKATKENVVQWVGGEKQGDKRFTMAYPKYDRTLKEFIKKVSQKNLMSADYLAIINERGLDDSDAMINAIDHADIDVLRAILTGYIRQERFGDGLWAQAVEDKVFLKILKRLDQMT